MHRWAWPIQAVVLYVPRQPEHWPGWTADYRGKSGKHRGIERRLCPRVILATIAVTCGLLPVTLRNARQSTVAGVDQNKIARQAKVNYRGQK